MGGLLLLPGWVRPSQPLLAYCVHGRAGGSARPSCEGWSPSRHIPPGYSTSSTYFSYYRTSLLVAPSLSSLSSSQVSAPSLEMCGDWPRADIFARWPRDIALELCSFAWPLITLDEVCRFFRCRHAAPQNIAGCEFTRAEAEAVELAHQEITVSVDPRHALKPGAHICMDLRAVLYLKRWKRALLFPPCTHQTLSDTTAREAKQLDGRMFWGILFVIWCYCAPATMS